MNISEIREGLKVNLQSITELRVHDTVPSQVNPPVAVVAYPELIEFDKAMGRGLDRLEMHIFLLVGMADDRSAQLRLDAYLAGTGPKSVKAAIESDKTLGGACAVVRVVEARNVGPTQVEQTTLLGAEIVCEIHGVG